MIRHDGQGYPQDERLGDYVLEILNTDTLGTYRLRIKGEEAVGIAVTAPGVSLANLPGWIIQALLDLEEFAWREFCSSYAWHWDLFCPVCGEVDNCQCVQEPKEP